MLGATDELAAVRDVVARLLEVEFELHDSDYLGGEYFRAALPTKELAEEIRVQRNLERDEPMEPDFPEWPTLVYVEGTTRADEIEATLEPAALFLLRRDSWSA